MAVVTSKSVTADKLLAMGDIGRCELIYWGTGRDESGRSGTRYCCSSFGKIHFDDSRQAVAEKVNAWLAYGAASVWVAYPEKMNIDVHYAGGERVSYGLEQNLVDDSVLPGFALPLTRIFQLS